MEKRSLLNFPIVPKDDPKQALRIRRFFSAAAAYVICGFFCYFSYLAGFVEWKPLAGWLIIASCTQIIMYIFFRTGLNLKMADPSLTAIQMCAAILLVMYAMYFANEARGVLLLIYVIILLFGIYRLNTRSFLYVSAFILLTYGGVIAQIHIFRPQGVNFQMEYLQFFVLALVLVIFSVIGGHISGLRTKISEDRSTIEWLTDNIQDVIFLLDMNINYIYVSPSVKILRGYEPEEVLKQAPFDALTPSSLDLAMKIFSAYVEMDKLGHKVPTSRILLLEVRRKDGTTVWTETKFSFIRDKNQRPVKVLGVMRDITERKQAEKMIRQGEDKYRTILESIQEGYFEVDLAGNFTFCNDSMSLITGCSKEELLGMNHQQFTNEETAKEVFHVFNKVYNTGEPSKGFDWQITRKDGTKRYIETSISLRKDPSGKLTGFKGIIRDITERKMAEEKLKQSEEQYRLLADNISEHVWLRDLNSLKIIYISPSVEKMYGYPMDEIGNLPLKKLLTEESFQKMVDTFIIEMPKALKTLPPSVHKYSLETQARHNDGHLLWMDNTISFIRDKNGNLTLLLGETRDITERKLTEEKLRQTLENLKKAIGTTIHVLVSALEARDPYTTGHQTRSADLATAIAGEMGLPPDKIEGLRMAGIIHDIGKLAVPTEILTKPTKLTTIEFSLIMEHCRRGYEMLKDIESPWPLAQVVHQHHERMDGSGYPRNLKGENILLEARILAVADVVEAMASHRPYRASLGIDSALGEIEKNKGILYDNAVADACLKLFREKGYQLIT